MNANLSITDLRAHKGVVVLAAMLGLVLALTALRIFSSHGNAENAGAGESARTSVDAASIPGAAVAITRGDKVIHLAGFGHDSAGASVTADTLFRVASLSKSFTALAARVACADRLRLDSARGATQLGFQTMVTDRRTML